MNFRIQRRARNDRVITLIDLIANFQQLYHEFDNILFLLTEAYSQISLYSPHSDLCQPNKLLNDITSLITNIKEVQSQLFTSVKAKQNTAAPRLIHHPQSPINTPYNSDLNFSNLQSPNNLSNTQPRNFPQSNQPQNLNLLATVACESRNLNQNLDEITPFNHASTSLNDLANDNFDWNNLNFSVNNRVNYWSWSTCSGSIHNCSCTNRTYLVLYPWLATKPLLSVGYCG